MAAGNAIIGALRVELGLNSAQFQAGLKGAQSSLSRFQKLSGAAFGALAVAATAAAATLAVALKKAADHADELGKTAQKIGVSVEALSRLEHAAKLSDVSLEQLSTGLGKLSQNLFEVASGRGEQARTSFQALGISVTDAAGNLKSADAVLAEVAERFGRMEDGSVKTALAMNLFGRAGRELIPLLNEGKGGLAAMAAEADRLGLTISTRTAKAAEGFNDSLTRMNSVFDGVANRILERVAPGMERLAETVEDPQFQQAMLDLGDNIAAIAEGLALSVKHGRDFADILAVITSAGTMLPTVMAQRQIREGLTVGGGNKADDLGAFPGLAALTNFGKPPGRGDNDNNPFEPIITGAREATEAIDPFAARFEDLEDVLLSVHDPFEQMKLDLTDLKTMWEHGRISVEQYEQAVRMTNLNAVSSTLGMASMITDALGGLFKDNKAFAVASAVINTAEGVTKALAQGGIFGFVGAAAVAAAGAAQIASILAANPGSSSAPRAPTAAAAPEAIAPASGGGGTTVNVTLRGGGLYSRNEIEGLVAAINDASRDGVKLRIAA